MADPKADQQLTNTTMDITAVVLIFLVVMAIFGATINQVLGGVSSLNDWVFGTKLHDFLRIPRIIFIILDILLFIFIVWVFYRYEKLESAKHKKLMDQEIETHTVSPASETNFSWDRIRELADSGNPSDWNMAILRADAILDDVLQHQGYEGESIAERLKIVDHTKVPSLDRVWSAHRLRNTIAHDPTAEHTKEIIMNALHAYQDILVELGVLEEPA